MKKPFLTIVCFLAIVGFVLAPTVQAETSVTLEWTANTEPDLAGYRAFTRDWNGSYDYANPAWQGTDTTCTIEGLNEAKLPHFVVRAYDTEGLESGNSIEVYLSNGPPGSPGSLVIIPQGN